jgi:hypothetical protein
VPRTRRIDDPGPYIGWDEYPGVLLIGAPDPEPGDSTVMRFLIFKLPGYAFDLHLDDAMGVRSFRVIAGVHDEGTPPPAEAVVTTRLLRRVPLETLHLAAKSLLATMRERLEGRTDPWAVEQVEALRAAEAKAKKRPGRAGRPPIEDARWAERYVELARRYPDPIQRLASELDHDPSYVRDRIYAIRRKNLITKATRGSAGGELTPDAIRILNGED